MNEQGSKCARTACGRTHDDCKHTQDGRLYCFPCARKINEAHPDHPGLIDISPALKKYGRPVLYGKQGNGIPVMKIDQVVHIDTDHEEWGRVASDAVIKDIYERDVMVEVESIRAMIIVPKEDVFIKKISE